MRLSGCLLLLVLSTAPTARADPPDPREQARNEFLTAYAKAGAGAAATQSAAQSASQASPITATADSEELQSYPLYAYLQARRIQSALDQATSSPSPADDATREFLRLRQGEPVARDLRLSWLRSLARRQAWDLYIKEYGAGVNDPLLRCQYLQARIGQTNVSSPTAQTAATPQLSTEQASSAHPTFATDIVSLWLTPRQLPQECEQVFTWARQNGIVTEDHIAQRLKLLLENDQPEFARTVAAQLSAERAAPYIQWADLLQQPQQTIDALIAAPSKPVDSAALLAGWSKLARKNSKAAIARFDKLMAARPPESGDASAYALLLALSLAWDHAPDALAYFDRVSPGNLNDLGLVWQARAALWANDWKRVRQAIAAMPDEQRGEARWRYWAARAEEKAGNTKAAHHLYESVLPDDNYYAAMAAARLKRKAQPHPAPLEVDADSLATISALPAFVRARELLLCQFRSEALAEWSYGLSGLQPEQRKQTIVLASGWGWHNVTVATASQQKVFFDYSLLYPRPYDAEVSAGAKLSHVPEATVYSVIRQESLFRPDAQSSANALGLMQMQIGTARRTARKWKRPLPTSVDLFDPATNVSLGAAHLRDLLDDYGGQPAVAFAAYNAGPNAARRWLPDREMDPDVWIENIPYNETREYVQRVHWHTVVFAWQKSGKPQDTNGWLKSIRPAAHQ